MNCHVGRQVRRLHDLLKEYWENPRAKQENVVVYLMKMRERLEQMTVLAQEHIKSLLSAFSC